MTMKRNIIAAVLLLAAVAYSCTTKEESSKSLINDGSVVYNPTATVEDFVLDGAKTKTVLTIDESTGANFTFVEDDVLGVFPYDPEQGDQVRFTVKSSSADACVFNGHGYGLKAGQLYATYYPADLANAAAEMATKIPVDYTGQVQTASDGETFDISAADYLVANGITPENNECHFTMKHVGALVVMDVTFPEGGTFTEISLNAPSDVFVQTGTIDLTQETVVVTPNTTANSAKLSLGGEGVVIDPEQTVRFCMMVAPVDLSDAEVKLVAKNDAGEELFATVPSKNFQAGYAYKLACTVSAEAPAEPTNLSEEETANTYIVDVDNINEAGYYFDATVAGNGATGTISVPVNSVLYPTGGTCALTKTGVSIKTHFNTNNCISDLAYDASSKTISFKASGSEGVAKITLLDADSDGIWTWLIWCTDKPDTVTYTNPTNNQTYTIMDRNLGAIMSSSSEMQSVNDIPMLCGLYYSWGRPIPLSPDYESNAFGGRAYTWGPGMEQTFKDPDRFTRNDANVFFNYYGFGDTNKHDVGTLWGDAQNFGGNVTTTNKTIYDPCPVGYKVAPAGFMDGYDDTASFTEFHADAFGVYIDGTDGSAYFPYAGRCFDNGMLGKGDGNARFTGLNGGDPDCDGCGYWIWTSGHVNGNTAWVAHLAYNNDGRARYGNGKMQLGAPAYACSVRCVAE